MVFFDRSHYRIYTFHLVFRCLSFVPLSVNEILTVLLFLNMITNHLRKYFRSNATRADD